MGSGFNMLIFNIVDPKRFAIVQLIYGLAYFLIIKVQMTKIYIAVYSSQL